MIAPVLLVLLTAAAPVGARANQSPPKATLTTIICHDEATKRYIEDFRRVGVRHRKSDEHSSVVTTLVNDNPRYEHYFAECKGRWSAVKVR